MIPFLFSHCTFLNSAQVRSQKYDNALTESVVQSHKVHLQISAGEAAFPCVKLLRCLCLSGWESNCCSLRSDKSDSVK